MIPLLTLAILLQIRIPTPEHDPVPTGTELELIEFVDDFLYTVRLMPSFEKRRADALANISIILKYCDQYQIDPLLVAVIMRFESSWKTTAVGKLGELGVMQTMPRLFKKFDLNTADGQIHAGVSHLRASLNACGGDLEQGLNYYGANRCKPILRFVRWRLGAYKRAVRKYREGGQ